MGLGMRLRKKKAAGCWAHRQRGHQSLKRCRGTRFPDSGTFQIEVVTLTFTLGPSLVLNENAPCQLFESPIHWPSTEVRLCESTEMTTSDFNFQPRLCLNGQPCQEMLPFGLLCVVGWKEKLAFLRWLHFGLGRNRTDSKMCGSRLFYFASGTW